MSNSSELPTYPYILYRPFRAYGAHVSYHPEPRGVANFDDALALLQNAPAPYPNTGVLIRQVDKSRIRISSSSGSSSGSSSASWKNWSIYDFKLVNIARDIMSHSKLSLTDSLQEAIESTIDEHLLGSYAKEHLRAARDAYRLFEEAILQRIRKHEGDRDRSPYIPFRLKYTDLANWESQVNMSREDLRSLLSWAVIDHMSKNK